MTKALDVCFLNLRKMHFVPSITFCICFVLLGIHCRLLAQPTSKEKVLPIALEDGSVVKRIGVFIAEIVLSCVLILNDPYKVGIKCQIGCRNHLAVHKAFWHKAIEEI